LPIDRVFTLKGFGTVVTGTLWSGTLKPGIELVILPKGIKARIRGLEVHDQKVERALAGQRGGRQFNRGRHRRTQKGRRARNTGLF